MQAAKTPKFSTELPFSSPYVCVSVRCLKSTSLPPQNSFPVSSSASVDPFAGLGGTSEPAHPPSTGMNQSWLYPGGFARPQTATGHNNGMGMSGMPQRHNTSANGFRNGGQPQGRAASMHFPASHSNAQANDGDPFGLRGSYGNWNDQSHGQHNPNVQQQHNFHQQNQQQRPQQGNNFAQPYNRSRTVSESSIPFDLAMDDSAMHFDDFPPMGPQGGHGMSQQGSNNFNQHEQFHTPGPAPPMSYPNTGQQPGGSQPFYQAGPLQGQNAQHQANQQSMRQPSIQQSNQHQQQQAQRFSSQPNLASQYNQNEGSNFTPAMQDQQFSSRPPSRQAQQRQQRMRADSAAGQNRSQPTEAYNGTRLNHSLHLC